MTESKSANDRFETFDARGILPRVGLALTVIAALFFGWFAVRWQLGDMLATLTAPTDANAGELGGLAVRLAPNDAAARWLAAASRKNNLTGEAVASAANGYETVVRKSSSDYRWWVELGRAREQSDQLAPAEQAYRQAVALAPNYTYPHWQAGNFYLRQNRSEEAFAELKKAAQFDSVYREQVLATAWDYYEKDTQKLEEIAGDDVSIRGALAKFYAAQQRPEDSLRIWNALPAEAKQANTATAQIIAQSFFEKKFYRQSLEFSRSLGSAPDVRGETVQNAGFEQPVGETENDYFGWTITPLEKMEVNYDSTQKHGGGRSLRVAFRGYAQPILYHVAQIVTVEARAKYRLNFWLKTDNLKSGGTPRFDVINANDDQNVASSDAFPVGTHDWQPISIEFTAPDNAEAVNIRLGRATCGAQCPIFGTIWLDDFKLEKIK